MAGSLFFFLMSTLLPAPIHVRKSRIGQGCRNRRAKRRRGLGLLAAFRTRADDPVSRLENFTSKLTLKEVINAPIFFPRAVRELWVAPAPEEPVEEKKGLFRTRGKKGKGKVLVTITVHRYSEREGQPIPVGTAQAWRYVPGTVGRGHKLKRIARREGIRERYARETAPSLIPQPKGCQEMSFTLRPHGYECGKHRTDLGFLKGAPKEAQIRTRLRKRCAACQDRKKTWAELVEEAGRLAWEQQPAPSW